MMMRYMALILGMVAADAAGDRTMRVTGAVERFAPGEVSTSYSEVRLTLSPDGDTAVWFSRDRPGGAGGYDLWMSRRKAGRWSPPTPVPFNTTGRDFDPAFSADGRQLYFCSDRPGGAGGDDLYRVEVRGDAFGEVEWLGPAVNSAGNEFAPMLSPDGERLLFSSDRAGCVHAARPRNCKAGDRPGSTPRPRRNAYRAWPGAVPRCAAANTAPRSSGKGCRTPHRFR